MTISHSIRCCILAAMLSLCLAGSQALAQTAGTEPVPIPDAVPGDTATADMPLPDGVAQSALDQAGVDPTIDVSPAKGMEDYKEGGQDLSMEEAVRMALEISPSIDSAKAQALGAEDYRKSSLGAFFPSFSMKYSFTQYDHPTPRGYDRSVQTADQIFQLGANVHQDIFTGLRLENTYRKAQHTKLQLQENLRDTELTLIKDVQSNYLNLLKAREDVRSASDSVTRLSSQLRVTQAFYDVGLKPKLDVLQAEVDLAEAENDLLKARNSVATQQARLNTLLTLPLDAKVNYMGELAYQPFSLDLEECLKRAYDNRPDLEMVRQKVEIAKRDAQIAFSGLLPQVGADLNMTRQGDTWAVNGGNWNSPGSTEFSRWSVSVSAEWKIFDFGSTWYSWRQAQRGIYRYEADVQSQIEEVAYQIKAAHLKIGETEARIKVTRKALASAKESYRMAVARYQAQVGTNTDVLDAQARLTKAEANLTQALADYQVSLAAMYVAMGMKNYALLPE